MPDVWVLSVVDRNGLDVDEVVIDEEAVRGIVLDYTREAGVRNLERRVATICRKYARRIAEGADAETKGVTDQTKRTVPEKPTKEEIRQRYLNKALLRKNQSNRTNRTSRDRSAARE